MSIKEYRKNNGDHYLYSIIFGNRIIRIGHTV